MGRTAIYLHAIVQAGGRIELTAPAGVREGDELGVVLLTEDRINVKSSPKHILDILDALPANIGSFKSAQEVDAYVREERDSWER